jgi:hypothetical protein
MTSILVYVQLGESGRTPEQLEKAVVVLKKLVEKTRAENERLKKLPSFVSADQLNNLQAENTDLKVSSRYFIWISWSPEIVLGCIRLIVP